MKKLLLTTAIILGLGGMANAKGIDLKGFHLGMTDEQVTLKLFGKKDCRGAKNIISGIWGKCSTYFHGKMTLAGQLIDKPKIMWDNHKAKDRKVKALVWKLNYDTINEPAQFDLIKRAIKEKYPKLKCEPYAVNNAFGAVWENEQCTLEQNGTNLLMRKYKESRSEGFIQLYYKDKVEENDKIIWSVKKKDI